jgi:dihydrofolate reductase
MQIEMIVAVAENGVIGHDGKMPWRLSTDLKRFKKITMGLPIIMGRHTWESLPGVLPGRLNIIITSTKLQLPEGAHVVNSPEAALEASKEMGAKRVMIIGGGKVYKAFEAQAHILHLTKVHAAPKGDTYFRLSNPDAWLEESREDVQAGENDTADVSFVTLRRT